jgi:hypothetical protein
MTSAPTTVARAVGEQPAGKPSFWLNGLALALVVLAGGLCLAMPFWGDQALFTVYGRQLSHGAVLYRDLFDVKQPGIFMFYAFGGRLFGFTEVGIHLFELAYWLAFSVFALVVLRQYFTTRWAVPLVPVFTVVVYYLGARLTGLTQLEILVAFPILVAWWLINQADPGTHAGLRRYAAAGLAAAAVVLLKHLYIVIVVALVGFAAVRSRRSGIPAADIRRALAVFWTALVLPLLPVLAYFAAHGQLERIWWAYAELGPRREAPEPRQVGHLVAGARHFMIVHAPILILAVLGAVHGLRQRTRPRLDLVAGMVLWAASAGVAFAVQFWAEWHWLLFTVPVGILAAVGVEALVATARDVGMRPRPLPLAAGAALGVLSFLLGAQAPHHQTRLLWSVVVGAGAAIAAGLLRRHARAYRRMLQILAAALAVSVGLAAIAPAAKLRALMEHDFAVTVEARTAYQRSQNPAYHAADDDLAALRGSEAPGPWYVFGDPVLLLRADRDQAAALPGWGPEIFDTRAWRELHRDLRSTLPPCIVVDRYPESIIRARYPAMMAFVGASYEVAFVGASGTWYVLR